MSEGTARSRAIPAKQILLQLAGLVAVLGISAGTGLLLGPQGLEHYHDDGTGLRAHAHLHGGAHRHDRAPEGPVAVTSSLPDGDAQDPVAPAERPDDDAPAGAYVPAAGGASARIAAADTVPFAADTGTTFLVTKTTLLRHRTDDRSSSPRGPPA